MSATQVNFETIHTHDVEAARTAMIGDLQTELTGAVAPTPDVTLDA